MKFYNREKELQILEHHFRQVKRAAIMDVLLGRRRVGKTELVKQFMRRKKSFYFFVGRKPINSLLLEWSEILRAAYPAAGEFTSLDNFLKALFELCATEKRVVVFDEFQNFKYIDPPAFSVFQKHFDHYKKKSKVLLLLIGSIVTLMEKIFSDSKEPLFGRATRKLYLPPFDFNVVSKVLKDFHFKKIEDLFNLYSIFGGIPKYYSLIEEEDLRGASLNKILSELITGADAVLKKEGEDLLKEEFGKDYERYFEILSLVSRGKNKISEIANAMKLPATTINVYLSTLDKRYKLIERRLPLLEKRKARLGRYYLKDIFLSFWFRFIYRYLSLSERGVSSLLLKIINKEFSTYQGKIFEELVKDLLIKSPYIKKYLFSIKEIGSFWGKGAGPEIDIIAVSEDGKQVFLAECKINPKRITPQVIQDLIEKSQNLKFKSFDKKYLGIITLGKLNNKQKKLLEKKQILGISLRQLRG